MSEIGITITLITFGGMLVYSLRCLSALRDILLRHGKSPSLPFMSHAIIQYTSMGRQLLKKLKEEEDIRELKSALERADISIFLAFMITIVVGGVFLFIGN